MTRKKDILRRLGDLEVEVARLRNPIGISVHQTDEEIARAAGKRDALGWFSSRPSRRPPSIRPGSWGGAAYYSNWLETRYEPPTTFDPVWCAYEYGYAEGVKERDAYEERRALTLAGKSDTVVLP